jgi:hypothetical protein
MDDDEDDDDKEDEDDDDDDDSDNDVIGDEDAPSLFFLPRLPEAFFGATAARPPPTGFPAPPLLLLVSERVRWRMRFMA